MPIKFLVSPLLLYVHSHGRNECETHFLLHLKRLTIAQMRVETLAEAGRQCAIMKGRLGSVSQPNGASTARALHAHLFCFVEH